VAALDARFAQAWRAKGEFDFSHEAWFALVRTTFGEQARELPGEFFPAVYARFAEPDVWRVFDDVVPTLDALATHGVKLAVVSNWDERLRPLLAALRLESFFDAIVVSCEAHFAKPSPVIFQMVERRLAMPLANVLHVGDSLAEDVAGARGAGMQARLLRRGESAVRGEKIASLLDLPRLLGLRV
jgi:putative hydrolase of the HAD superfamily